MPNTFVFDLDSTVVEPISSYEEEKLFEDIDKILGEEFRKNMSIKILGYTHMVYPGFYALFKWIHDRGDRFFFFSTGTKERNAELVPELMKRAFPENHEKILSEVKIFSSEKCIDTRYEKDGKKYQPHSFYGQLKKKLEKIIVSSEELKNTLLIDDDPSYMTNGEEKNFVCTPSLSSYFSLSAPFYDLYFTSFHKSFYIRGILEKILKTAEENKLSLSEASWSLIDDELKPEFFLKKEMRKSDRPKYLHKSNDPLIYDNGLKLLKSYDPDLDYLFKSS
ncbi:MAG: hypothetical protein ACQEQS_08090 [Thermodesulfobacteriota bacterium]